MIDQELKIKQGDDVVIAIPVLDEEGTPVVLTGAVEIVILLMVGNVTQGKYSTVTKTGYGTLTIGTGTGETHIISLLLRRTDSKNFPLGGLSGAISVKLTDVVLGHKVTEYDLTLGSIITGYTREEILLTP